jgi:hypothetical protein
MANRTLERLVPTNASALGAIRALLFGFVLLEVLRTDFADFGRLPTTVMRPTGAMQLVPWRLYDALMTPQGMIALKAALLVSLAAATVGYFTSPATKIAAALFLFYEGLVRSFGHFNHDEMPVVYLLLVLAFTPCADALSLDALFRGVRQRSGAVVYGYPILLTRLLVAWSYFTSAVIKMRVAGSSYFNPDNLPALAISHSLDNLHDTHYKLAFWLPNFRTVTAIIVVMVVLWEFAFPLAIFSRVARRIILSFGILFHLTTIFFMNVSFPYHLASYVVFVDWPQVFTHLEGIPFLSQCRRRLQSLSMTSYRFRVGAR